MARQAPLFRILAAASAACRPAPRPRPSLAAARGAHCATEPGIPGIAEQRSGCTSIRTQLHATYDSWIAISSCRSAESTSYIALHSHGALMSWRAQLGAAASLGFRSLSEERSFELAVPLGARLFSSTGTRSSGRSHAVQRLEAAQARRKRAAALANKQIESMVAPDATTEAVQLASQTPASETQVRRTRHVRPARRQG